MSLLLGYIAFALVCTFLRDTIRDWQQRLACIERDTRKRPVVEAGLPERCKALATSFGGLVRSRGEGPTWAVVRLCCGGLQGVPRRCRSTTYPLLLYVSSALCGWVWVWVWVKVGEGGCGCGYGYGCGYGCGSVWLWAASRERRVLGFVRDIRGLPGGTFFQLWHSLVLQAQPGRQV